MMHDNCSFFAEDFVSDTTGVGCGELPDISQIFHGHTELVYNLIFHALQFHFR